MNSFQTFNKLADALALTNYYFGDMCVRREQIYEINGIKKPKMTFLVLSYAELYKLVMQNEPDVTYHEVIPADVSEMCYSAIDGAEECGVKIYFDIDAYSSDLDKFGITTPEDFKQVIETAIAETLDKMFSEQLDIKKLQDYI